MLCSHDAFFGACARACAYARSSASCGERCVPIQTANSPLHHSAHHIFKPPNQRLPFGKQESKLLYFEPVMRVIGFLDNKDCCPTASELKMKVFRTNLSKNGPKYYKS